MKILVDKVPEKPEECCFGKCGFSGYYCQLLNGYLCTMHTLNRCDKLIGLDKIAAIEVMPSPAYLPPNYIEHDIRVREDDRE